MIPRAARPAALLGLLLACGEPPVAPPPASAPIPSVPRPVIELAGCREHAGERCWLEAAAPATLHVWIDLPASADVSLAIDGQAGPAQALAVEGGQRWTIPVPATARRLELRGLDPAWDAPWVLSVEREALAPAVLAARREAHAGHTQAAAEQLRAALGTARGRDRLDALQLLRQLAPPGDPEALRTTEAAAELALALGRTRDLADAAAAAAMLHMTLGELAAAHRFVLLLERRAATSDEARVWARYYGGVLASRTGDLGTALRSFDEARRGARRLGMSDVLLAASELLGPALAELGRGAEALAVIRDTLALADAFDCKSRARVLGNAGWAQLLLAEAGLEHDPPAPLLDEQLALVGEDGACPDPETAAYARVNLALVALAEHEPDEALVWLDALRQRPRPAYLEPWIDEIAAQIGLEGGRWSLAPPEVARPDPGGSEPGLRFTALVRHARTLERWGLSEPALASYLAAEDVLEQALTTLGVDTGRELFLAGRSASAIGLVDGLVASGRVDEALCRARLARSRALRSLDRAADLAAATPEERERRQARRIEYLALRDGIAREQQDDWRFSEAERSHREARRRDRLHAAEALLDGAVLARGGGPRSCDALAGPAAGEVMLVQFPSASGHWLLLADETGVDVAAMAPGDEGAAAALGRFQARLAAARRIRVMPTGEGWSIPFHALPVGDGMLLDAAPLVWALDLGPRRTPARGAERRALVVADPSEDLPHARREAVEVEERLRKQGWSVRTREGAAATRAAIVEQLAAVELFHYAGHGTHAGPSGWRAALLLHDGDTLGVGDILALPDVPAAVLLTGCDTATVRRDTLEGGMNLGRAFVLAGAEWVLAAEGKVDDALALELGRALAEGRPDLDGAHAAATLRQAQLRLRAAPVAGWDAFRILVP